MNDDKSECIRKLSTNAVVKFFWRSYRFSLKQRNLCKKKTFKRNKRVENSVFIEST